MTSSGDRTQSNRDRDMLIPGGSAIMRLLTYTIQTLVKEWRR